MLMAAGLGTRLRPFTDNVASKPSLPLFGIPIAQFAIDALAEAGVTKVVANVHFRAKETEEMLRALDLNGIELVISDESTELLGSSGGIRKALPELGNGPFYLLNADVLSEINLRGLAFAHQRMRDQNNAAITFALSPGIGDQDRYREFELEPSGKITRLGDLAIGRPFWTGAAVLETRALELVPGSGPSDFVQTILLPSIQKGQASGFLTQGIWFDIGSPPLWAQAHLNLIERLETGHLPKSWRDRIESGARRVGQEIWVDKKAPLSLRTVDWVGPCYWSNLGNSRTKPPRELGPDAVLYGQPPHAQRVCFGIGHSGNWVGIKKEG